jgi:hypothetical protein
LKGFDGRVVSLALSVRHAIQRDTRQHRGNTDEVPRPSAPTHDRQAEVQQHHKDNGEQKVDGW